MSASNVHRRLNLLTGDWVLVSPHRLARPWQGAVSAPSKTPALAHDPACYLCPGSTRSKGARNPAYEGVYVFDNDFPALLGQAEPSTPDRLLVSEAETGVCRVICYSPDHSKPMSSMAAKDIHCLVDEWANQTLELMAMPDIAAVTIFENRGEMMGASNPHPHGQVWATRTVPNELFRECERQRAWAATNGRPLLSEYVEREVAAGERVVLANAHFVVLVPYWAAWPFETLVLPVRPAPDLPSLDAGQRLALAEILSQLTAAYVRVFDAPFPYTMGWHQRPAGESDDDFVVHAHFYPPLLRSASIRKFMVGFEMLAMPQRDITPESAAERLRYAAGKG